MKLLDILNSSRTLFLVLLVVVGVNGYLFYDELAPSPALEEPPTASTPAEDAGGEEPAREADVPETTRQEVAAAPPAERTVSGPAPAERAEATYVGLDDLRGIVRGCEDDSNECVRESVEEAVPGARYLGGREDLAGEEPGGDTQVLYFEAPGLEPCESVTEEYGAEDATYAVIMVGQGTLESEEGAECIPTA